MFLGTLRIPLGGFQSTRTTETTETETPSDSGSESSRMGNCEALQVLCGDKNRK